MLWKIYAILYALVGLLCCIGTAPGEISVSWIADVLVSTIAAVALFRFAYGRTAKNLLFWKCSAVSYVAFDLIYNLYINPVPGTWPVLLFMLPSYVLSTLYGWGRCSRPAKGPAAIMSAMTPGLLDSNVGDEEIWLELEKRHALEQQSLLNITSSESEAGESCHSPHEEDSISIPIRTKPSSETADIQESAGIKITLSTENTERDAVKQPKTK